MRWLFLVLLVSACSGAPSAPTLQGRSAAMDATIDFDRIDTETLVGAIELLTNQMRTDRGLPALSTHATLRKAARKYAAKMVSEQFLAHEDPNTPRLRTPQQRVAAAGASNPITAENIADVPAFRVESGEPFYVIDAENYVIAREPDEPPIEAHSYASFAGVVVGGWMDSPGHRRNLLAADAVEQGIGAQMYLQNSIPAFVVVQVFQVREPLN